MIVARTWLIFLCLKFFLEEQGSCYLINGFGPPFWVSQDRTFESMGMEQTLCLAYPFHWTKSTFHISRKKINHYKVDKKAPCIHNFASDLAGICNKHTLTFTFHTKIGSLNETVRQGKDGKFIFIHMTYHVMLKIGS